MTARLPTKRSIGEQLRRASRAVGKAAFEREIVPVSWAWQTPADSPADLSQKQNPGWVWCPRERKWKVIEQKPGREQRQWE